MANYLEQKLVKVSRASYIYRVVHRVMEGDCQCEHGPIPVTVGPLQADVYPVTNHMYWLFMQESGYRPADDTNFLKHWVDGKYLEGDADKPVTNIDQNDARAYAAHYGKRLPKDFEWQYLAAGPDALKWPWGDKLDLSKGNFYTDALSRVDAYPQGVSPVGCMDMCGNSWEMVEDTHDDGCHFFTLLRGGCYYRAHHYWHAEGGPQPNDAHLKMHLLAPGMDRNATVGFRCVKDCDGEEL